MKNSEECANTFGGLRQRAERFIGRQHALSAEYAGMDLIGLIHELELRQAELQIQNEELKSARTESEESRNRYFELFEHAPVGYINLDSHGLITRANLAARTLLGITVRLGYRNRFSVYIHPEDRGIYRELMSALQKTGKGKGSVQVRTNKKTETGAPCLVHVEIEASRDAKGNIEGWLAALVDITERKQVEKERRQLEERLQAGKAESLSRMAGAVAHHFNNVLAVIMGNLELALDDLPPGTASRKKVIQAMRASQRAEELSRFMLTYLGKAAVDKERLDLSDLVAATCASLTIPPNVELRTEFPAQKPVVQADRIQARQIVINLVTNAVEAIGEQGGAIVVTACVVGAKEIRECPIFPFDWKPKTESYAYVSVGDTGPGLDEAGREKVFDPFYSTKFTGRGLGLPSALGWARAHGGAMSVASTPGRGATFKVFLPI